LNFFSQISSARSDLQQRQNISNTRITTEVRRTSSAKLNPSERHGC